MTPAQESSDLQEWFVRWKRDDPLSFWIAILFAMRVRYRQYRRSGNVHVRISIFGRQAALSLRPRVGAVSTRITCKLPSRTYFFGYELAVNTDQDPLMPFGRVCRDIVKGGWVLIKGDGSSIIHGH
jgi:hypothetical protein